MAAIEELIRSIADPRIRDALSVEVARLKAGKKFGLVFEEHLPETVLLPGLAIKVGARVMLKNDPHNLAFRVIEEVNGKKVKVIPDHVTKSGVIRGLAESIVNSAVVMNRADLVVAKAFGEPMYPALIPVDAVERAPGKPWHVLINADNYHALQLLQYGYTGKVDVIYIDPPYNTGARDWKYNNDYVDGEDRYKHSKWLSMMRKRLALAKLLLAPDGTLICTIDEHEVHHLGTLLDHVFPECSRQMVTVVINAKGVSQGRLARVEEYAMYAFMPGAKVAAYHDDLLSADRSKSRHSLEPRWERLLRGGNNARREDRPKLFYPIHVDPTTKRIVTVGEALPLDESPDLRKLDNQRIAWPIRTDGTLGNYQVKPATLRELADQGFVKLGGWDKQRGTWTLLYLNKGTRKRIDAGDIVVTGRDSMTGAVELSFANEEAKKRNIKTVWVRGAHDSGIYGSSVLRALVPSSTFSFPKSVYAVRDAIGAAARHKPQAIVLDFFAGSGTTLNAVAMLNATDGGDRRAILVTNNEVSETDATRLHDEGEQPGSPNWEANGIAESVTWPRVKACLTGRRPNGAKIDGEYLDGRAVGDGFEENAAYFKLDFLDPDEVSRGEQFEAVIPILWMLAGSVGACASSKGTGKWFVPSGNRFAVLLKEDCFGGFREELAKRDDITHVFLVTDSAEAFNDMAAVLGSNYTCLQLYRSYIDTFRINLEEPGTRGSSDFEPVPAFAEGGA